MSKIYPNTQKSELNPKQPIHIIRRTAALCLASLTCTVAPTAAAIHTFLL
jgi:hypothetical protein